jgi:hypothetical protein
LLLALLGSAGAYVFIPQGAWTVPQVAMQLQLGPSGGTLDDGATSWGQSAELALSRWNAAMGSMQFTVVRDSTATIGNGNGVNNVFWSSSIFGSPFGGSTLAVTTQWIVGGSRAEADVIFNTAFPWNSYRGPLDPVVEDFHRVATHEFGHALGLGHPDDEGQIVSAIMNAVVSDLDVPQNDDLAGAAALYPGSGTTTTTLPGGGCGTCPPEYPHCGPDGDCWSLPCTTLCGSDNCCGGDHPDCGSDESCYVPFDCGSHAVFPWSTQCNACAGQAVSAKIHKSFSKASTKYQAGKSRSARKQLTKADRKLFKTWRKGRIDDWCYHAVERSIALARDQVG